MNSASVQPDVFAKHSIRPVGDELAAVLFDTYSVENDFNRVRRVLPNAIEFIGFADLMHISTETKE